MELTLTGIPAMVIFDPTEVRTVNFTPPIGFDAEAFFAPFYWHQGWEMFPGVHTPGRSPVGALMDNAGVPRDLSGASVLDVGAWNGCLAFECERRGASRVVGLSLEDPDETGFNALKGLVGAERTSYTLGSIYDLDAERLGTFDLVICFGVIYHLRYPVLGLDNLRRVTAGTVYIESHALDDCVVVDGVERSIGDLSGACLMQFYPGSELANDPSNWFSPSISAVTGVLRTAGFDVTMARKHAQRGYWVGRAQAGLPPFVDKIDGRHTYEGQFYDLSLRRLLGPKPGLAVISAMPPAD